MRPEAWRDVWSAYADAAEVDRQRLAEVDLPVTLLAGRDDAAAGSAGLIDLHRTLGNSRLESIVGPHMLHLERPLSFRSAVARHLAWVSDLEQVPR
jgi:pimeloyl-ACP methyl ester carboxylesterase